MIPQANPYRTGGPLTKGNLFIGRKREITKVVDSIIKGQSISIYGERRIGKTSLLYKISEDKRLGNFELIYLSMETIIDESYFWQWLGNIVDIELEPGNFFDIEEALHKRKKRLVLMLDEFDKTAQPSGFSQDFFNLLRAWCSMELINLIISSLQPLVKYSFDGGMTSPFFNIFSNLHLGKLSNEEAYELLNTLTNSATENWPSNWKEEVINKTENHPYFLQLFCSTSFDLLITNQKTTFQEALGQYKTILIESGPSKLHTNVKKTTTDLERNYKTPTSIILILFSIGAFVSLGGINAQSFELVIIGFVIIITSGIFILFR